MKKILDPLIIMRKDGNKVIAYPKGEATFMMDKDYSFAWKIINPRAAIVLALFDGYRDENDVVHAWSIINACDKEKSQKEITAFLKKYDEIMIDIDDIPPDFKPYDPTTLVCDYKNLEHNGWRLKIPHSMLFLPTLHCGFKCQYCYADITNKRDPNELTLKEIERIFNECVELRFSGITLSGGDPFLRNDIFEIIGMLYDRGFKEDIPTKSALSEVSIKKLMNIGVKNIQMSLDSPLDTNIVEQHVGIKGYFPKIMRTLEMLGGYGFKVGITCVLTKYNIDSVPDMIHYYGNLGFINRVSFTMAGSSIYRNFSEIYADIDTMNKLEEDGPKYKKQYPHMYLKLDSVEDPFYMTVEERKEWYDNRPQCSGGRYAFILLPDGKVTLCEELYYEPAFIVGDLRKQSIPKMWQSPEMMRVMEPDRQDYQGSPCYECEEFYDCHTMRGRCWKRAMKAYRDEPNRVYWPDPYCPQAPPLTERLGI